MERLRRSFTFSGRKRRQSEEEQKKSRASPKNEASGSRKNDENGTENPDAGFRPRSGSDRLHKAEDELETMRKQFGDAEDRYREAHGVKRTLSRENDDLRAELGRLRQRQEKTDKELTSLKQENTNLLTEMSQLDCSREDLAERLQRQTHSLGKELQDSRAAMHQQVHKEDELQKECNKLKDLINHATPEFASKLLDNKDTFPVRVHVVFKGVSEGFVKKSVEELVKKAEFVKANVSEWTGEREVAEPAAVVVFFCLVNISNQSSIDSDIKRVSSLGNTAILVPLAVTKEPLNIKSTSMLPISSSLIKIDITESDGCLSSDYLSRIIDACKVTRLSSAMSLLSS